MIQLKSETGMTLRLADLTPFQGDLKKRTAKDMEELCESILTDGLIMPFAVWSKDGKNYLLDGHGRYAALSKLALKDVSILEQEFPVLYIEGNDENEARKALLQIVSIYGKISKSGVLKFSSPIIGYKAPVLKNTGKVVKMKPKADERVCIRVWVPRAMAPKLMEVLNQVEGLEIE